MIIIELIYQISEAEGVSLTGEQCEEIIDNVGLSDIDALVIGELRKIVPYEEKVKVERR